MEVPINKTIYCKSTTSYSAALFACTGRRRKSAAIGHPPDHKKVDISMCAMKLERRCNHKCTQSQNLFILNDWIHEPYKLNKVSSKMKLNAS